ncbi:hypothetical protein MHYP_G00366000 [Metynnis hypsauchen]
MAPPLPLVFLLMTVELHVEAPEEVTERETADLTCKTTCSLTDPTFIWNKDGHPLTTKTIKNNQLHLQTISSEDAGSYSCAVRGDQHLRSTAHSLRVRYPPKSVSVSISPSGEIVEGSSVTLTCSSDGNPAMKNYTWFKGSTPVGEGKTYSIPNIRSEDSGEYTCQSRNDLGERRSTAVQINVLYPPKNISVSISPSSEIVEGSSVTLTCSSDGNPPVKIYTWFKEGESSPVGSGQNCSIINITADHTGLYYCEAQNDLGAQRSAGVPVFFKDFLRAGERGRMEIQINQSMRTKAVKTTAPVHLLKTSPVSTRMLLSLRSSTETITSSVYHTHNCSNSPLDSHS